MIRSSIEYGGEILEGSNNQGGLESIILGGAKRIDYGLFVYKLVMKQLELIWVKGIIEG